MSSAHRHLPHYTVDDYRHWQGDWELWDGIPISMSPSPFGRHAQLVGEVVFQFKSAVRDASCNAVVLPEIDWIVSDNTVVRPDVTVLCGEAPEKHVVSAPALVVEVHSPSTKENDRNWKKELYQAQKVNWYIMVDPEANSVTTLRRNERGQFEQLDPKTGLDIDLCEDCTLRINPQLILV